LIRATTAAIVRSRAVRVEMKMGAVKSACLSFPSAIAMLAS
jgi:hypothetical protein